MNRELWHDASGWYLRTASGELCGPYDTREELLADDHGHGHDGAATAAGCPLCK